MRAILDRWGFARDVLSGTLSRWEAQGPSALERTLVHEFLMDLSIDPLSRGREDRETGIWIGRVGPFIQVIYIPNREERVVSVVDIDYA